MTTSPSDLIQQTRQRLIRQRQFNRLGICLPIALACACLCWELSKVLAFPWQIIVVPVFALAAWLWFVADRVRQSVEQEFAATLIDEKTDSKDRFLTFSTAQQTQTDSPLFSVLQQQIKEKASVFQPDRDVPFTLDRRVLLSLSGSALCILALIFLPPLFSRDGDTEAALPAAATPEITQQDIKELEEAARMLTRKGASPQEQAVGEQLRTLAEQLKDPTIPPEQKQQLTKETQQKIKLSMPQILPLDLKIFANDSKDNSGDGDQKDQSKKDGKSSGNSDQPTEQGKNTSSSGTKDSQQPGQKNDQQAKNEPQPKQDGGGIKFDQPQQKTGESKEQRGQGPGEQQRAEPNQAPNSQSPGSDPNQPGGNDGSQKDQQNKGPTPNPDQPGQGEGGKGSTISGGRGERFTKPGDQPGGFLTKDARFVKVRIPMGNEPQGRGDVLADNYDPAQPKTPYSNAPLKDAPPDAVQPTQQIPLEYRTILK